MSGIAGSCGRLHSGDNAFSCTLMYSYPNQKLKRKKKNKKFENGKKFQVKSHHTFQLLTFITRK